MRVLLIEDDPLLGDALQAGLHQNGFAVEWLKDGMEGLAAMTSDHFDAVVPTSACRGSMGAACSTDAVPRATARRCWCSRRATRSGIASLDSMPARTTTS